MFFMALGHWRPQEEGYPSVKHGRDFELSGTPAQLNVSKTLYDLWLGRTRHSPGDQQIVPSGKLTKNYGKSQFLMGKSTIKNHFQ